MILLLRVYLEHVAYFKDLESFFLEIRPFVETKTFVDPYTRIESVKTYCLHHILTLSFWNIRVT